VHDGCVKDPSTTPLTSADATYEGRMKDVIFVVVTLVVFVGFALLIGVLDRSDKDGAR
jgi:hypothetical protein